MDSDPNNDPEFIKLFTITDSDEDSESDDDESYNPWHKSLRPSEFTYDRTTRIQQANRELFSEPLIKKMHKPTVQFDPIPQKIMTVEGTQEIGADRENDDIGKKLENTISKLQPRSLHRDTQAVLVVPRRFNELNQNKPDTPKPLSTTQISHQRQYTCQPNNSVKTNSLCQQHTSGENHQNDQQQTTEKEQQQTQIQTPKKMI